MLAVVPDEWIEERHRLGLDRKEEMWDGVLHLVPPASSAHGEVGSDLAGVLGNQARRLGLGLALGRADGRLHVRTDAGVEEV
jgi:Uma2 family endonuclease